ncbi:F plasmid transfer operon protein TraF [Halospina denitrificans]|uniref:F plasmid transfer operon protein TraF n=1 Tax=Halospina denitrificans TaxID=332522 RepID=A0A4R7K1Q0_9GAMM|nr:conjugal transfer protein TraF [Halospina denitrificans]TDT43429.1 F plasmid transfer operon protein TraF [Halospina denitrificans]
MTLHQHSTLFRQSRLTLAVALVAATATSVHAAPPAFQDVRALGMGGTGVAAARPSGAALFNPALLSADHSGWNDGFAATLPSVNARVAENDEVTDEIDQIQDTVAQLETSISTALNTTNPSDLETAQNDAQTLAEQLRGINQESMRVDAGLGTLFAVPSPKLAVGVHANAQLRATVQGRISENDTGALEEFAGLDPNTSTQNDIETALGDVYDPNTGQVDGLESDGRVLASAVSEVGLSLARRFSIQGHDVNIGVTPKMVQMRTFDYVQDVNEFDENDFDASDFETDDTHLNLDIGASTQLGAEDQWQLGASVRNLIPQTLKTVENNNSLFYGQEEMKLDPLVTVGVAHTSSWHTLTADLDLTKNEGIGPAGDQQFLSVGGEFNVYNWVNVRAGARQNLASDTGQEGIEEETQFTAGLALSPWALRVELGALVSSEEVGAAAELGMSF